MSDRVIVYDVETQFLSNEIEGGWNNVFGMKIASCVCYSYEDDLYHFFGDGEEEHKRLLAFLKDSIAVTFNGIHFDSQVLLGNDRVVTASGWTQGSPFGEDIGFNNYDMHAEMWKSFFETDDVESAMAQANKAKYLHRKGVWNLDSIVKATFGGTIGKTANGCTAPQKFQEGRMRELYSYNLQDVRVEKRLFEHCKKFKFLINGEYDIIKLR